MRVKHVILVCTSLSLISGCASTPQEDAYREYCRNNTPKFSMERWDCLQSKGRTAGLNSVTTEDKKSGKAADALLMGIICAATPNPSACMSGAAKSISGAPKESDDERLERAEQKTKALENSLRSQCLFKGGFYNSITGCSR